YPISQSELKSSLQEVEALLKGGAWLEAKTRYQTLIQYDLSQEDRHSIQKALEALNMKILFSPLVAPDSFLYTVQPGDSLSFIARDYGVSVESIMWANGLRDSNSVREGNVLKIPPVSGVIHTVKKGDTISTIAKKYAADSADIIAYNDLPKDGKLQINDELIVPDGKITRKTATGRTTPNFAHLPNLDGYFAHPTKGLGRITQWIHGRNGIDVANSYGTPIYASADGVIVRATGNGWNGGYGLFVKMSHSNGTDTLYAHLSKVLVDSGQSVQKGQQIGNMGSSGRSTGSHLHFEVHGAKNPLIK
ncbi:MAG: M23 family metallopeptidase, partial [Patescibacteria group bacterium]